MTEKVGFNPSGQFNFRNALEHYLTYNPQDTRSGYVISAQKQAELLSVPPGGTLIELAGGSGNSGLAFLESCKTQVGRLIILDRSDNIVVAGRRFNQVGNKSWEQRISGISVSPDVLNNIKSSQEKSLTIPTPVRVLRAQSQEIPLRSEIADGMFCVQGFHWFLFADGDIDGKNPRFVLKTLKEMRRVLKKGAELVFDTHGGAVDFGDSQVGGRLLNELHFRHHPFSIVFGEALNKEFREAGFSTQIDPERPNKYFDVMDEKFIGDVLQEAGFKPIALNEKTLFQIEFIPIDIDKLIVPSKEGGQMVYFTNPEVSTLSEPKKADLLNEALDRVVKEHPESLEEKLPYYEFLVFFKAQAI